MIHPWRKMLHRIFVFIFDGKIRKVVKASKLAKKDDLFVKRWFFAHIFGYIFEVDLGVLPKSIN